MIDDPASVSNINEIRLKHVDLDLTVDFTSLSMKGKAVLTLDCRIEQVKQVVLDVFQLKIEGIQEQESKKSLNWEIKPFTDFGEALYIDLPTEFQSRKPLIVEIQYICGSGPGICWLTPEQTAMKRSPFVYTQGQEVLNRSFFPCQDSPSIRITYSAEIQVPKDLTCVMSAKELQVTETEQQRVFFYEMEQSIPVYLVAMAVGFISSAQVGPRSKVWAEPCVLEDALNEFKDEIETYLSAGESLFGPYLWGAYDLLIMPPSFPYGGMENPRLTFATPCLVTGDKSLIDVIAHEICHSWFGNLVTNATWSDFFLNEGFTMYAQRRVMTKVHGRALADIETKTGQSLLESEIEVLGKDSPLTRLRVPLEEGIDPGDCYNECAYEKGFAFVAYLRSLVDSDETFDTFLRSYCEKFKFQSIQAEEMIEYYLNYFPDLSNGQGDFKDGLISWKTWLHQPGFPLYTPDLSAADSLIQPAESLAEQWCETVQQPSEALLKRSKGVAEWPLYQKLHFLDACVSKFPNATLPSSVVTTFGSICAVKSNSNAEIQQRWLQIVIKTNLTDSASDVVDFLAVHGKQKYLIPIYRLLWITKDLFWRNLATESFKATTQRLHVMVRERIVRILT